MVCAPAAVGSKTAKPTIADAIRNLSVIPVSPSQFAFFLDAFQYRWPRVFRQVALPSTWQVRQTRLPFVRPGFEVLSAKLNEAQPSAMGGCGSCARHRFEENNGSWVSPSGGNREPACLSNAGSRTSSAECPGGLRNRLPNSRHSLPVDAWQGRCWACDKTTVRRALFAPSPIQNKSAP